MNVVFRTDASHIIGTGHVMRCLTLAQACSRQGASVTFICRRHEGHLCEMIEERGFPVQSLAVSAPNSDASIDSTHSSWLGVTWQDDVADTIATIEKLGSMSDWLIVDHYALNSNWEKRLRPFVRHIMVIDDLADRDHDCDVLLDQNYYGNAGTRYQGLVPDHCQLLIGPRFALLRDEFRVARIGLAARSGRVDRLLVFFGGSDHANNTSAVLDALEVVELAGIHVDVVIGGQHQNRYEISEICHRRNFECHVQTDDVASLMKEADVAIGAGGTAVWERCCMGLPCLTFSVADNQRRQVHDAALAGVLAAPTVDLDNTDAVAMHLQAFMDNALQRENISRTSMSVVDAFGVERVRRAIGISSVSMREAIAGDSEQVFKWRNSETVRELSLGSDPIDWSTHCDWFKIVLAEPDRLLLIGESSDNPVGVVRFDITDDEAHLSIYLVPGNENRGLGADLLLSAERWLTNTRPEMRILHAEVLSENIKSHKLFLGAGYSAGSTKYTKRLN